MQVSFNSSLGLERVVEHMHFRMTVIWLRKLRRKKMRLPRKQCGEKTKKLME
jgi:hypothetical protein